MKRHLRDNTTVTTKEGSRLGDDRIVPQLTC